jgi:hypothetical protein
MAKAFLQAISLLQAYQKKFFVAQTQTYIIPKTDDFSTKVLQKYSSNIRIK